jgi:hypothetical protein
MKAKEALRWTAILGFAAFGFYHLVECLRVLFRSFAEGDWAWAIFALFLTAVIAGVPLAISFFAFRREYRHLTIVVAVVAAFCVGGTLISLPSRFGIQEFVFQHTRETPWLIIIALPLSLLCLFGPFYAAAWFFRLCLRLADRYIHHAPSQ